MHCVQLVSAACPAIAVAVAVFVAVAFYANVRYVLLTKRIKRLHKSVQQPSILPGEESECESESEYESASESGLESGCETGTNAISIPIDAAIAMEPCTLEGKVHLELKMTEHGNIEVKRISILLQLNRNSSIHIIILGINMLNVLYARGCVFFEKRFSFSKVQLKEFTSKMCLSNYIICTFV